MEYEMEELLPIVAQLAEKYTSNESTSISYERAKQLMEAVLYCINRHPKDNQLMNNQKVDAKVAYEMGYECLLQKVKDTQQAYNEMIISFHAYGNENYHDTVTKAIPGFFRYYDIRFSPQETMITMDYPTLFPVIGSSGIDAVAKYVECISYEQKFMNALPEEYVYAVLYQYQPDYRKQFYNICSIVLRRILTHMMLGKALGKNLSQQDYQCLKESVCNCEKEYITDRLSELLEKLIGEKYDGDKSLERYLQTDIKDFVTQLYLI